MKNDIKELDLIYLLKKAKDFYISESSVLNDSNWYDKFKNYYFSLDKTPLPEKFGKNNRDGLENTLSLLSHFEKNKIFSLYLSCEKDFLPQINNTLGIIEKSNSFKRYLKSPDSIQELIFSSASEGNNLVLSKGLDRLISNKILDNSLKQELLNKTLYSAIFNHQNGNNLSTIKLCFSFGAKLPDFKDIDTVLEKDIFESFLYSHNKDLVNLLIEKIGSEFFYGFADKFISELEDNTLKKEMESFFDDIKSDNKLDELVNKFETYEDSLPKENHIDLTKEQTQKKLR